MLVSLKKKQQRQSTSSLNDNKDLTPQQFIEKFQQEHEYVIDHCEIDLVGKTNLKEPFEILFEHFMSLNKSRLLPTAEFNFYRKESLKSTLPNVDKTYIKNFSEKPNESDQVLTSIALSETTGKKCACSII